MRLTLEQHGFELYRSTYMQIFSIVNTTVLHDLQLVESARVELRIWRANYKLYAAFRLGPCVVQGSLMCKLHCSTLEILIRSPVSNSKI